MQNGTKSLVLVLLLAVGLISLAAMDQWNQHKAAAENTVEVSPGQENAPTGNDQGQKSGAEEKSAENAEQERFDELNPNVHECM